MGLLDQLLGRERRVETSAKRFTDQRADAALDIVGEASYQPALQRAAGELGPDGPANRAHSALVMPEPDNKHDRNAVAVYLYDPYNNATVLKVGYLSRENAIAYRPVFGVPGAGAILTEARLKGGWRRYGEDGTIGVELHLGTPSELICELWADSQPPPSLTHRWHGQLIAFTGDSLFGLAGVRLDRPGQEFLAKKAGCEVWPRVTKQVRVCVASRPETLTGKLDKAEQYGLELVREEQFWSEVGFALPRA